MDGNIRFAYAKNRAEELGHDVYDQFVVPLFYDWLEIRSQKKSFVIIGGRGCGKTTLLRYLSHSTQFSPKREELNPNDLSYIGLYLRADTNFLSSLQGGGIDPVTWKSAFNHSLACELGIEILNSLASINANERRCKAFGGLADLCFDSLKPFDREIGITHADLKIYLTRSRDQLVSWINNLDMPDKKPVFLPGATFLQRLIEAVQSQLPYLSSTLFAVFIDEYENLHEYQQRIINGLIKHGQSPLVFNVAVKRNGMPIKETDGNESIQNVADFREIDLEERIAEDFELFAAELLFSRLAEYQEELLTPLPVDLSMLRDASRINQRKNNDAYRSRVMKAARDMLPRLSETELAGEVLRTERLKERLLKSIDAGIRLWNSNLDPKLFVRESAAPASVVCGALLNRKNERPESVLKELENYDSGRPSRFDLNSSQWLHNNLFGCLLQIFSVGHIPCPLFSGFDNFLLMSQSNIRHFLELIHCAFLRAEDDTFARSLQISIPDQADAVREASSVFVRDIRSCGKYGNQLHGMTLTLGAVFRHLQQDIKQSEPEINHFYISEGDVIPELEGFLAEAVKWSVLLEREETKKKAKGAKTTEFVLNPVFAGHFQISYRRKRSIGISTADLITMFTGDVKSRDAVVKGLVRDDGAQRTLPLDLG